MLGLSLVPLSVLPCSCFHVLRWHGKLEGYGAMFTCTSTLKNETLAEVRFTSLLKQLFSMISSPFLDSKLDHRRKYHLTSCIAGLCMLL